MFDKAVFQLPGIGRIMAITCVFTLLRAGFVLGQAVGLASVIVNVWEGQPLDQQAPWLALFLACFVGRQVVLTVQSSCLDEYAHDRAEELRNQLLSRVFSLGPLMVQQHGSASVASTVIQGVEDVRTYLGLIIPKMTAVVAIPLVLLVAVFALDWVSGVIALVCFPFIILYMVMIGHTAKDDAARRHGEFQQMANHFVDAVGGMDELRAFGQSRSYGDVIYRASERFRQLTMKTLRIATLSSSVLDMFSTLALAGVAVMLGFRLVTGSIDFFPALTVLILVPEYFRPIREFASDYHASLDGRSAFAAIRAILSEGDASRTENEGSDCKKSPSCDDLEGSLTCEKNATWGFSSDGGKHCAISEENRHTKPIFCSCGQEMDNVSRDDDSWGRSVSADEAVCDGFHLALRDVGYAYPDHPYALKGVSLQIEGACKVGIIGASGSGKSTLMGILSGFADPSEGCVELEGAELPSLRTPLWQRRATFIPQDPYLFSATLRENVSFYRPDADEAEVQEALRLAGLESLVEELPQGLDTMVGQGGRVLSGGQAHRVALARAFLDESRTVLLFDEPTAHLDIETELELKERMLPLMEGKLVFFATHRLHWMHDMDYVLEMKDGRVTWQGSAAAWLEERGR